MVHWFFFKDTFNMFNPILCPPMKRLKRLDKKNLFILKETTRNIFLVTMKAKFGILFGFVAAYR